MNAKRFGRFLALLKFEWGPLLKGPLPWGAAGGLIFLVVPIRFLFSEGFSQNGQTVALALRLNYVLAIGYSAIVFLTTLFTLSLCLERTGAHYLRNNDLLILAREVGRSEFYLSKIFCVLAPAAVYGFAALLLFWEELYRLAGVNLSHVFLLIFPLTLSMACLIAMYFLARNFFGNFMIFFLSLLLLPVIYFGDLWHYYGGIFRAGASGMSVLDWLPQFGGIHAYSLGMVGDVFLRETAWQAVVNLVLWTLMSVSGGLILFRRKRF